MGWGQPLVASTRYETLGAGTGTGTTVTAGTANSKGSYATIGTSTFEYDGILLQIAAVSAVARYRLDIAINTGGSDTIVAADLFMDVQLFGDSFFIPISIPSGAVVKAALQSTTTSATANLIICGFQGDGRMQRGFSRAISCTDWTNTDPTGSITLNGTTQTAWSTVQASTAARVAALYVMIDGRGNNQTNTNALLDIGIGAAASEKVITTRLIHMSATTSRSGAFGPIPCDIPAGSRLAARAQASAANVGVFSVALAGLAA